MVSAELKVVGGKHAGQVIPLNRRKFLIGREQDCQLRPNSEMVSRHHCVFSVDDFSVRLRDLGSTNGTLVNGERIRRETVLNSGDRILIGNLDFELVLRPGVTVQEADSKVFPTATALHSDTQTSAPTVLDASGGALGPYVTARFADASGNYQSSFMVVALLVAVALLSARALNVPTPDMQVKQP